jgi:GNAT superfamily N-acetyltransferase
VTAMSAMSAASAASAASAVRRPAERTVHFCIAASRYDRIGISARFTKPARRGRLSEEMREVPAGAGRFRSDAGVRTPHDAGRVASIEHLTPEIVIERHQRRALPERWRMTAESPSGIRVVDGEILDVDRGDPRPGDAVCLVSGRRLCFRRVLAVRGRRVLVRGDVAPFADGWFDDVVGRVRPRGVDRFAALAPGPWTEIGWTAAIAAAHAFAGYRHLRSRARDVPAFSARPLSLEDWPEVRAFWLSACGSPLPLKAQPSQHVVGLFGPAGTLVGVNIQLVLGDRSYSAYTLVDRRHRGLGGGRHMIDVALGIARAQGVKLVYVHIHARNLPSIAAYEASGFRFARWWTEESDPLLTTERQWRVYECVL